MQSIPSRLWAYSAQQTHNLCSYYARNGRPVPEWRPLAIGRRLWASFYRFLTFCRFSQLFIEAIAVIAANQRIDRERAEPALSSRAVSAVISRAGVRPLTYCLNTFGGSESPNRFIGSRSAFYAYNRPITAAQERTQRSPMCNTRECRLL